jgi:Peptidase A4 family/Putative Ig domain
MSMAAVLHKILISLLASLALLLAPATSLGAQPKNYWLLSSTGQVFAYGKAKTHGSEAGKKVKGKITGIKGTANGGGYWIVTTKTHYSFGDASRYKYHAGGLKKYTGKVHPKGLKGKIVGYAVATLPTTTAGGGGTHTTTTGTTTTPAPPTVSCSSAAIETSNLNSATAGAQYSQTLSAGGVSGGSWAWSVKSGNLPSGLSLSSSGALTGTPSSSVGGTQSTFTVQATNSQCQSNPASKSFTLAVAVSAMSITTSSLPDPIYGQAYSTTLAATGGQPGDYQWSAESLPGGLSMASNGTITGSPTGAGTYNGVAITVSDTTGATSPVTAYFTMTVNYPPLQITSPTSLTNGQATIAYSSVTFAATGGTPMSVPAQYGAGDYNWAASGLPSGMSMSSAGTLSGTPTQSGAFTVAVTLTDGMNTSNHITDDFSLTIADAPLAFTTSTLTANQGQAYTGHVIAQGGQAPYTMYRLSGSLPTGMTFNNGTITVASTVASGEYQFTIGVTDSQSNPATAQETFSMWIAPGETSPDLNVGSSSSDSIWAGYVEQASSAFTSVSGTFTVPTVHSSPANEVSPWVGIDGYGTNDLIQSGVTAQVDPPYAPTYEAWWETVGPSGSAQDLSPQNQFEATPGDTVNVNIWQLSAGQWEITLNDATNGQGFATQVSYTGTDDTAEWIVENSAGAPATGYAATSTFSNLDASESGTGMLDLSTTGATPSSLTGSGFSITDYN